MAWTLAAWHPDRVRSLTAVSVPHPAAYTVAYRADPEQKERSGYIRLFWQAGKAEEVLLADDARRLRRMLSGGEGDSGVPAEAIDEYVAVLSAPGALTAALNWYRAMSSERSGWTRSGCRRPTCGATATSRSGGPPPRRAPTT